MHKLLTAALCCLALGCQLALGSMRKIGVKGYLTCGESPLKGAKVEIWEKDTLSNDELKSVKTDAKGYFELVGEENELGGISPYLKIYHDCNDGKPCQRKVKMDLPQAYVEKTDGQIKRYFNLGTWNMMVKMEEEGRDCWH